jgi:hypothetical protein
VPASPGATDAIEYAELVAPPIAVLSWNHW